MSTITIQEVERDPSLAFRRVEAGETLLVVRDAQPVAEIKPAVIKKRPLRPYGLCAGQVSIADDFDAPLPDHVLDDFAGA